jgi:hypothetical protein
MAVVWLVGAVYVNTALNRLVIVSDQRSDRYREWRLHYFSGTSRPTNIKLAHHLP